MDESAIARDTETDNIPSFMAPSSPDTYPPYLLKQEQHTFTHPIQHVDNGPNITDIADVVKNAVDAIVTNNVESTINPDGEQWAEQTRDGIVQTVPLQEGQYNSLFNMLFIDYYIRWPELMV